jgi:hypothetical protein
MVLLMSIYCILDTRTVGLTQVVNCVVATFVRHVTVSVTVLNDWPLLHTLTVLLVRPYSLRLRRASMCGVTTSRGLLMLHNHKLQWINTVFFVSLALKQSAPGPRRTEIQI